MSFKEISNLGNHLLQEGLLEKTALSLAYEKSQNENIPFITYLVDNKILSSEIILNSCKKKFGLIYYDLACYDSSWKNNLPLSSDYIIRYHFIPLFKENEIVYIGISDPTNRDAIDITTFQTGIKIQARLVCEDHLSQIIKKYYCHHNLEFLEDNFISDYRNTKTSYAINENFINYDEPIIRLVNQIIKNAILRKASDIHIEPSENSYRVRYRENGLLEETSGIPSELSERIISRLKIMAKIDISEKRLPQDSRISIYNHDIRINTCPTLLGEKIVLRILNSNQIKCNILNLGLTDTQCELFIKKIKQPQGLVLVTGPTGSGKTMSLYSALNYLNSSKSNILTIEDPVEIQLPGINQININAKIGLNFSTLLRSVLRQDPDIIMVGEIRDSETAEITLKAAQTGHLVFSTLHANSAVKAFSRLNSFNIPYSQLTDSLSLIIAQRLIRKLCEHCKKEDLNPTPILGLSSSNQSPIYCAVGCKNCLEGYQGRTGIYELLPVSETLIKLLNKNVSSFKLTQYLENENFFSLKNAAREKVLSGITSLAEIERVISYE